MVHATTSYQCMPCRVEWRLNGVLAILDQHVKLYEGTRIEGACKVTVDGSPLPLRHDLRNHSPTGAEWGYGGSGPAQLALALLADALGDDELAERHYQKFKFEVVARFEKERWLLTRAEIRCWIAIVLSQPEEP